MIKLILVDLDGTLLNDEKHVPERNIFALREAMKKGIHVSIATGRNYFSAKPYIDELGLDVPVILQNGAFIYMPFENKILYESPLPSQIAREIITKARRLNLDYILFSDFLEEKDMYMDIKHEGGYKKYLEQNHWRLNFVKDVMDYITGDTVAEVVLMGNEKDINQVIKEVHQKYGNEFSSVKNNVVDGWAFFEFFGRGASKEAAFEFLLKYFKIAPDECMFFGDNFNDIGLLKRVGFPVVMENAPEEVKKYGKFITLSNNNGGVGYAIEEVLF
ncbi:HAD family hydrolase [Thermosipho ferrireducens]|uniref:HAD family hydrolase n=1 Tax=Thermosipho ferrireducens TaxID=2571116 RepID=A0ABX7S7Q8_9BACT|nr:HAD family hydrolase [Thermosipho ferrireducens]QTA38619.1 HAD family hydrolase [Thermosipho ferrireducens]